MSMDSGIKIGKKEIELLRKQENSQGTAEEKKNIGSILLKVAAVVIAVVYYVLLFFGKYFLPEDGVFLSSLNVFSGAENPNHWIRIISLCILTLSISAVLRFFIARMEKKQAVTKRIGKAVIELLGNLVKYVAIIVLIFLILSALGVNTTELLAGLGILTLILGLGVTSLIEDIVAGIFIIAERLFDVDDIVVVDGFRGTVVSIGIRSTKFADVGGDILIMRNSSIGSLINLTDRTSSAALTIPVAPKESFERVDSILRSVDWDSIRAKYPQMVSGPLYLGLCDITPKGVQSLLFVAGCREEDKFEVQRILYMELRRIFESSQIELGAPVFDAEEA